MKSEPFLVITVVTKHDLIYFTFSERTKLFSDWQFEICINYIMYCILTYSCKGENNSMSTNLIRLEYCSMFITIQ